MSVSKKPTLLCQCDVIHIMTLLIDTLTTVLKILVVKSVFTYHITVIFRWIQDFKLGGAHLKKLRRAEEGAKIFGVFHDYTPTNHILGGARAGCASPPLGSAPDFICLCHSYIFIYLLFQE